MRIYTFGQHLEITPAFRSYLTNKFSQLTSRMTESSDLHVRLERDKGQFKISVITHLGRRSLHTAARALNAYTAIDVLAAKLNRLVIKMKEKKSQRRSRESRSDLLFH